MKFFVLINLIVAFNLFAESNTTKGDLSNLLSCSKSCDVEFPLYPTDINNVNLSDAHPEIDSTILRHVKNSNCKSVCSAVIEKKILNGECQEACRFDISYNGSKIVKARKKISESEASKCIEGCVNRDNLKKQLNQCLEKISEQEDKSNKNLNSLKRTNKDIQNIERDEKIFGSKSINK